MTASDIGFADPATAIAPAARQANADALRLHRAGDVRGARAGFERAIALSPGYAMAHYNRACALARLGEIEAAARELEPLLAADAPTFGPRLRGDEDLAALRDAPAGAQLLRRLDGLAVAWDRAAREGVPAVWVEDALDVRPGVYLHASKRFVPLGPDEHDTLAALYDPASRRSTYLVAVPSYDGISHLTRAQLLVHAGDGSGVPMQWRSDADFCGMIEAGAIASGAALLAFNCSSDEDSPPSRAIELTAAGGRVTWSGEDATGHGPSPATRTIAASALSVRFASGLPDGYAIRGNELVVPGRSAPIRLGPGHAGADLRSVVLSPARDVAIVVSVHARCDCEHDSSVVRHAIDRVRLVTGAVDRLSQGGSMAAALFGPDGALYLQDGDNVRRLPAADAPMSAAEPVPAGVLLGVLRFVGEDCCSA